MSPFNAKRILVMDDESLVRKILSRVLTNMGFEVDAVESAERGIELVDAGGGYAMAISDMNMAGMSGLGFIEHMRGRGSDLPIVILTGNNEVDVAIDAISKGASDYLFKDENITRMILISVNKVLERRFIEEQNKSLMAELGQTVSRMNAIIDTMADGLLVTTAGGAVARATPSLCRMFRLDPGGLTGRSLAEVFDQSVVGLVGAHHTDAGEVAVGEVALHGGRVGKAVATAIVDSSTHQYQGSVVLIRDITDEKEVDRMKTDFIATVSHELRTPLTSIIGFARIIQKKFTDLIVPALSTTDPKVEKAVGKIAQDLGIIVDEGDRLTALVNNVLDLAKIEAGKVEMRRDPVDMAEVLDRSLSSTSSLFEARASIRLVRETPESLPRVTGDADRLVQVVINLLSNAVKFTDAGEIACCARAVGGSVVVSVRDSGVGIAEADCAKVFDKFKQVGDTLTGKPRGTGLGLPICKEIVERHGGQIWLESAPSVGSTFSFSVPIGPPAEDTP